MSTPNIAAAQEKIAVRKGRMAVLARCSLPRLEALWGRLSLDETHRPLRGPEAGLVMLRGRIGGTGEPFNIGEATVTRASVALPGGAVGHALALGREERRVQLAAIVDALCQEGSIAARIDAELIAPLRQELDDADETRRRQTAATRVDFFTMVRGED